MNPKFEPIMGIDGTFSGGYTRRKLKGPIVGTKGAILIVIIIVIIIVLVGGPKPPPR